MSDFKVKMHQNRFRLGLRPRPHWGSLQRSQWILKYSEAVFKGPTSKRKEGGGRGRDEGNGREGKGGGGNDLTHPLSQIPGYATAVSGYILAATDIFNVTGSTQNNSALEFFLNEMRYTPWVEKNMQFTS